MYNTSCCLMALSLLCCAPLAAEPVKNYSLGISSAATSLGYKNSSTESLSGAGLTGSAIFADNGRYQWAARLNYAYMKHDDFRGLRAHNTDANVLWGSKLNREGFSWAIGGGVFNDRWNGNNNSATFNGAQVTGGIAYHWSSVSVDFWLNMRNSNAYKLGEVKADSAVNGALALSYRF